MPALLNNLKRKFDFVHLLIFVSFLVWVFMFRGFVFGKNTLIMDALPYYDHFKYFIDNLMRGVYPNWDPFIAGGIPNEFFLRRIGSFNPFYSLIIIFRLVGLSFLHAYLFFLALYFWLGMLGFYLLSYQIFKHRFCAFVSYLLLMFSSVSTINFSSFLMLSMVPSIWFFFFFLSFLERNERWSFVGGIFTLMIIMTTYLPFYFLHNLFLFIICCLFVYPVYSIDLLKNVFGFLKKNKIFSIITLMCLCFAMYSGYVFFKEMATGDIVMSVRHKEIETQNTLMVAPQTYVDGGIMSTTLFDEQFSNFSSFVLGRFYIPVIFCVLFALGAFIQINKRIILMVVWAFLAYLSGVYEASPVYQFLYEHVFYIKYMRNFQYFLWINIMPVLILLSVEHLKLIFEYKNRTAFNIRWVKGGIVTSTLIVMGIYMLNKASISVFISLIFCGISLFILFFNSNGIYNKYIWIIMFIAVIFHPLELYSYLEKNSMKKLAPYGYDAESISHFDFVLYTDLDVGDQELNEGDINQALNSKELPLTKWIGLKSYINFNKYIPYRAVDMVTASRLQLYDSVYPVEYEKPDYQFMAKAFLKKSGSAFISLDDREFVKDQQKIKSPGENLSNRALITSNSKEILVNHFGPNNFRLKTDLTKEKFLVYSDNFERKWSVFIDGKKEKLYKANLTYKGVWIPSGKHEVEFKYGGIYDRYYNLFLLALFYGVFIFLLVFMCQRSQNQIPEL